MRKIIPYGKHYIDNNDIKNVVKVLKSQSITQGPKIEEFEKKFSNYVNSKFAVAVSSCTAGLHLSLLATGMNEKKNVITTPITFVSTANVIKFCNSNLILVDIEKKNLCLSIDSFKKNILGKKVNFDAIMPVHFSGNPFDTKKLRRLIGKKKIIIEDAAHALGSKYKDGSMVGSCKFANITVFSLHPVKTIATGEGGMITTNDKKIYKKLLRLRSHGINKLDDKFLKKKYAYTKGVLNPWYYEMQDLGYNYRMTEIQASLGITQLKKIKTFLKKRKIISNQYFELMKKKRNLNFSPIFEKPCPLSSNHLFIIKINFSDINITRADIMKKLKKKGIITQVHYIPIPMHPYYSKNLSIKHFPNAKNYYDVCLSIPIFYKLKSKEQKYVFDCLCEIIK